jgi:hypothetical protein
MPQGGMTYEMLSPEMSIDNAARSGTQQYKFEYQKIGEQDVVSLSQLQAMESRLNERNDPRKGAQYAIDLLRSSSGARRQAGF